MVSNSDDEKGHEEMDLFTKILVFALSDISFPCFRIRFHWATVASSVTVLTGLTLEVRTC
jgi:hypothetical protein